MHWGHTENAETKAANQECYTQQNYKKEEKSEIFPDK